MSKIREHGHLGPDEMELESDPDLDTEPEESEIVSDPEEYLEVLI